jgi:hypothetical protein
MTDKNKGRDRWHGATPKATHGGNYNGNDPLAGWFNPGKLARKPSQQHGMNRRRQ